MFSKELENLIQATLADGILEDHEKAALVKRAQREGVDLDELEIYIQSILQKRVQNQKAQIEKETATHEQERKGNVCPHCGTEIPPMTKICPNCGRVVNSNETSGDKELNQLVEDIQTVCAKVKTADTKQKFKEAKAECEALLKKADLFYGTDKKVQMLVYDAKEELKKAEEAGQGQGRKDIAKEFSDGLVKYLEEKDHSSYTYIHNFPIPTEKQELIDFICFIEEKVYAHADRDYKDKGTEAVARARSLYRSDPEVAKAINSFENTAKEWEKKNTKEAIQLLLIMLGGLVFLILLGSLLGFLLG